MAYKIKAYARDENGNAKQLLIETAAQKVMCQISENPPMWIPLDEVINDHAEEINENTNSLSNLYEELQEKEPLIKNAALKTTLTSNDSMPILSGGTEIRKINWTDVVTAINAGSNIADIGDAVFDLSIDVALLQTQIAALSTGIYEDVTANPWSATFGSLDGLTITGFSWNKPAGRMEV